MLVGGWTADVKVPTVSRFLPTGNFLSACRNLRNLDGFMAEEWVSGWVLMDR